MKKIPTDMAPGTIHKTKHCGDLEIISYLSSRCVLVRFFSPLHETTVISSHIRNGSVKNRMMPSVYSVGYLGEGHHKTKDSGKVTPAYNYWKHMLARCYSEVTLRKFPSYRGCTTCPEWHNFQVFADWFEENFPKDGVVYELDKDIKIQGNREYSPASCLFVTRQENNKEKNVRNCSKTASYINPLGKKVDVRNIRAFCRDNKLNPSSMRLVSAGRQNHHKGWKAA